MICVVFSASRRVATSWFRISPIILKSRMAVLLWRSRSRRLKISLSKRVRLWKVCPHWSMRNVGGKHVYQGGCAAQSCQSGYAARYCQDGAVAGGFGPDDRGASLVLHGFGRAGDIGAQCSTTESAVARTKRGLGGFLVCIGTRAGVGGSFPRSHYVAGVWVV